MTQAAATRSLPPWLKVRLPGGPQVERIRRASRSRGLATVCEQARCPNLGECWGGGTATFMVMGERCTRGCRFCSVKTAARPAPPDPAEPENLARTLAEMKLSYAVLTTVCRDDLPDQGAEHLAACIRAAKLTVPEIRIEMLMQDFRGSDEPLQTVLDAEPDVPAHNVECVDRLTAEVRDRRASYRQSLQVLARIKQLRPAAPTKTSLMLGLGETTDEVLSCFDDLRNAGVDIVTLGQYLRPSSGGRHLPVARYLPPDEFDMLGEAARARGFLHVASGPLVRSSYRASELFLTGRLGAAHAS